MAHARIKTIRFKDGRAPLTILSTPDHATLDEPNWTTLFLQHARHIASSSSPIAAYFMVAVYEDGAFNSASRLDHTTCTIPASLWPAYVEEIARRKIVTSCEVRQTLDEDYRLV